MKAEGAGWGRARQVREQPDRLGGKAQDYCACGLGAKLPK